MHNGLSCTAEMFPNSNCKIWILICFLVLRVVNTKTDSLPLLRLYKHHLTFKGTIYKQMVQQKNDSE